MDTYSVLRIFAGSWVVLCMFIFFLGVFAWAFRPGSRKVYDEISNSIFRNETQPVSGDTPEAVVKEA